MKRSVLCAVSGRDRDGVFVEVCKRNVQGVHRGPGFRR